MGTTRRRRQARRRASGPSLAVLSLTAAAIVEAAAAGTPIAAILGRTAGSALTLVDDAGGRFALSGSNLVAGPVPTDHAAAPGHWVTIRETLAGYANSPRDTLLAIAVTPLASEPLPNPPAGNDIILAFGDSLFQSIVPDASRDPLLDADVAGTSQFVNDASQSDYQSLRTDTSPIWGVNGGNARISPLEAVLRRYAALTSSWGRGVTVVPGWKPGAQLLNSGTSADFDPSTPGDLLVNARTAHDSAYALVTATKPHSRVRAVAICLNSNGNSAGHTGADNRNAWIGLIDYVRANCGGVDDETIFILAGPCTSGTTADAYRADIEHAATQRTNCYVVHPPRPTASGDNLHPTQAENRTWGAAIADAIYAAPEPATVQDFSIASVNGAEVGAVIVSEPFIPMVGRGIECMITVEPGLEYSIDGRPYSSAPGVYYWGNVLRVRLTSSSGYATATSRAITVGGTSASFNVTTRAETGGTTNVVSAPFGSFYSDNGAMRSVANGFILETV